MSDVYINPKDIYALHIDSWRDYWNDELGLFENTHYLLENSIWLPNKTILSTIAATYTLIPTKMSFVVPVLFCWGDKGSGKSTLSLLANSIRGFNQLFSPSDTFASLRNALDGMRWIDSYSKEMEKEGAILAWDNINEETLKREPKIYQLLLYGYNRRTDRVSIANNDGTNKEYNVFCPKIISSVEPLHLKHEFNELHRRLLIIPHKPFEKFSKQDLIAYQDLDINIDKLDLDSISWDGVHENFYKFWNDLGNCTTYATWRNQLTKKTKKSFKIPKVISSARWTICIDLICTGLTLGVWDTPQDAVNFIAEYWNYMDGYLETGSATQGHLQDFIQDEVGFQLKQNEILENKGLEPIEIIVQASKLKERLIFLQQTGSLEITPRTKDINNLMWELGWKLTTKGWMQRQ
ncbi:MAG: hypothetical protein HC815_36420 [Richelia sp. RM1_1_1]|nr:hypothetical protein [Richelia sp. RM1_1_1]